MKLNKCNSRAKTLPIVGIAGKLFAIPVLQVFSSWLLYETEGGAQRKTYEFLVERLISALKMCVMV